MYQIEYINKLPDSLTNFSSQEHAKYESAKGAECNYTPFKAGFTGFVFGECMWKAHSGQAPDKE